MPTDDAKVLAADHTKLPTQLTWATIVVCVLPIVLHLLGVDFGSSKSPFVPSEALTLPGPQVVEAMFNSLTGSFTHTLLEWSAFVTAIFVVILAFVHFKIRGDITTPVVGVALFCAGSMDAFHTLAADRLIEAVADNRDLIPFTWAISRVFNALITIVGVGLFLVRPARRIEGDLRFVILVSLVFGVTAYGIIQFSASSANLPRTTFPDVARSPSGRGHV